jgi:hypothetical protein
MAVLLVKISLFFSKITPNLRLKTLLGWNQLFRGGPVKKLRTLTQTHTFVTKASEIMLVGRKLALLSHLGSVCLRFELQLGGGDFSL